VHFPINEINVTHVSYPSFPSLHFLSNMVLNEPMNLCFPYPFGFLSNEMCVLGK
jgi:hypothetical protein